MNGAPQRRVRLTTPIAVTVHGIVWLGSLLLIDSPVLYLVKQRFEDHGFGVPGSMELFVRAASAIHNVARACFIGIAFGLIVDAVVYRAFDRVGHDGVRLGWFWALVLIPLIVVAVGVLTVGIPYWRLLQAIRRLASQ